MYQLFFLKNQEVLFMTFSYTNGRCRNKLMTNNADKQMILLSIYNSNYIHLYRHCVCIQSITSELKKRPI